MFSGLCQEGTLDKSLRISVREANKDNYKVSQCFQEDLGILRPKIWQWEKIALVFFFFETKKKKQVKNLILAMTNGFNFHIGNS